jgi:hypothetical protein
MSSEYTGASVLMDGKVVGRILYWYPSGTLVGEVWVDEVEKLSTKGNFLDGYALMFDIERYTFKGAKVWERIRYQGCKLENYTISSDGGDVVSFKGDLVTGVTIPLVSEGATVISSVTEKAIQDAINHTHTHLEHAQQTLDSLRSSAAVQEELVVKYREALGRLKGDLHNLTNDQA